MITRYALLAALTGLIPLPVLDTMAEDLLRRRLLRLQLRKRGLKLPREDVAMLANRPAGGCGGIVLAIVLFPVKKLLRWILWVWQLKDMTDTLIEVVHHALLVEEALDRGWVPGDAKKVRAAMNRATTQIDTRPIERALATLFAGSRRDFRRRLAPLMKQLGLRSEAARKEEKDDVEPPAGAAGEDLGADGESLLALVVEALRPLAIEDQLVPQFVKEYDA